MQDARTGGLEVSLRCLDCCLACVKRVCACCATSRRVESGLGGGKSQRRSSPINAHGNRGEWYKFRGPRGCRVSSRFTPSTRPRSVLSRAPLCNSYFPSPPPPTLTLCLAANLIYELVKFATPRRPRDPIYRRDGASCARTDAHART